MNDCNFFNKDSSSFFPNTAMADRTFGGVHWPSAAALESPPQLNAMLIFSYSISALDAPDFVNQYNEMFVKSWSISMASWGNCLSLSVHSLYFSTIHASCPTGLSDSA